MEKELKQIKDLKIALKDMEPYVKNPTFLTQGKRFSNFNMLIREAWANLLICAVMEKITGERYTFQESDGDGIIGNIDRKTSHIVEHVCAMDFPAGTRPPEGEERVLWAIKHKTERGAEYARNKILVVFFDGAGLFVRSKIRESIFGKHKFKSVICIGLLTEDDTGYEYILTEYRDEYGNKSISYRIKIPMDFSGWAIVQQIQ